MKNPMSLVNWNDVAPAAIKLADGWNIVRPMSDGQFAVIALRSGSRKLMKVLPTLERARAYLNAISTN